MRREVEPFAAAPCRYARADAVRGRANMHGSVAFKFATVRRGVRAFVCRGLCGMWGSVWDCRSIISLGLCSVA